jgi:PAS domain S-box-containing protein
VTLGVNKNYTIADYYINNLSIHELQERTLMVKHLFDDANDAIFFGFSDKLGFPQNFIHVNKAVCDLLGYTQEELLKTSPDFIYEKKFPTKGLRELIDYYRTKKSKVQVIIKSRDGTPIPMEVNIRVYELNNEKFYLAIGRDVSNSIIQKEKAINHSKLLERILIGIPDIIGVYDTDHTIIFYNEAGYKFYNKTSSQVKGKKCYEMLCRTSICDDCKMNKAIQHKKIIKSQRYVTEINAYVDCCWNPVLDESGEVMFVIEQIRDITERKRLETIVNENAENYNQIVNLLPDAVIISVNGTIVCANKTALKYDNYGLNKKIYDFTPGYEEIIKNRLDQIVKHKISKTIFDYKIVKDKSIIDLEASSSYINYNGKPAVLSLLRDVTKRKKELNTAAIHQQNMLNKIPDFSNRIEIETLYLPAKTVSGDFFSFHKVRDDLIIGILGDVSGKGVSSALSISAFNVLFHEATLKTEDPEEIINILNHKIVDYINDHYIAACCFSLDFKSNTAKVIGAGINQFITRTKDEPYCEQIIKGPFLGMFDESSFGQLTINFESGDKFYFLSDGLDFIYDNKLLIEKLKHSTLKDYKNYLYDYFQKLQVNIDGIKDDSTLLAIEIK